MDIESRLQALEKKIHDSVDKRIEQNNNEQSEKMHRLLINNFLKNKVMSNIVSFSVEYCLIYKPFYSFRISIKALW